jgi:hypothetical protein
MHGNLPAGRWSGSDDEIERLRAFAEAAPDPS